MLENGLPKKIASCRFGAGALRLRHPAPGAGCRSRSAPAPNRQEAIFFGRPFSSIRFKRWDAFDETVAADSLDRAIKQPSDLLIGLGPEELFLLAGPAAAGGGKTQD